MSGSPNYPVPFNDKYVRDIEHDPYSDFSAAFLGDEHIPTPSSMEEDTVVYGGTFEMPNGNTETQERFRYRVLTWTWNGLNFYAQQQLKSIIDAAGDNVKQLMVPAPLDQVDWQTENTNVCVKPNGLNAYKSKIRYNRSSGKARYVVTMTWREVPGTCAP